eukprot:TRINITY_DN11192_c0_g1_i2.p1 TRINITY_DN11192_c0_g1~~TRINITY_DN11192_c0_g1_i2.p1  ORF type:complete len:471 (+),score=101.13 TRINITY_DN11192_c0_g1_i2:61-1473(+)
MTEPAKKTETKLWGGRFEKRVSNVLERFSESISYDKRLYRQDIAGSLAHAEMLSKVGLMTEDDFEAIKKGLLEIRKEIDDGTFVFRVDREDIHMNIEGALTDRIGEPAKKLHTARSRNDQVLTDVRLYVRDEADAIINLCQTLQVALLDLAQRHADLVMPGYTHLQRAQPVMAAHYLLAYVEMIDRDIGRFRDARERLNFSPLGSCALAGTGLPIDRHMTAQALGFRDPLSNSIDAVSDRDFLIEIMSAIATLGMHLSRLAEEWVMWATEEFSFIIMDDSVATGSSIMPQKKNPDPMELVRGKVGRVYGNLFTLFTLTKGLPLAYNRDLQEDKEPLFDSIDTAKGCLEMTIEFATKISFNERAIQNSLERGFLDATTLADYLVLKGMPFRSAHSVVGKLVGKCATSGLQQLAQLSLGDMQSVSDVIQEDVFDFLGVQNAINKFRSYGSTGREAVRHQMERWSEKVKTYQL